MLKEYVNDCMYYLDTYCTEEESYFLRHAPYEDFTEENYEKIRRILQYCTYLCPGLARTYASVYLHEYMMEKFPTKLTGDKKVIYIYSYIHHTKEERIELAELLKRHAPEDHERINKLLTSLIVSTYNTGLGLKREIESAVNSTMMTLALIAKEEEIDYERMHLELEKIEYALVEKGIHLSFFELMHEQLTMYEQLLEGYK